jgi:hypothetical protein
VVWAQTPNLIPYVHNLLNSHDDVFARGNFDSVEDYVEVVDLSAYKPNIEGLDGTVNIDFMKELLMV